MTGAMTRSELAARLAQALPERPSPEVEKAVRLLINNLAEYIANGEGIEIRGFGRFSLRIHPPSLARNPKTSEQFMTGERRIPHFRPGKAMRERVGLAARQPPGQG